MLTDKIMKRALQLITITALGITSISVAKAQGPSTPDAQGIPMFGAILECSDTDYTEVAAKALAMDSLALRQALAGGKLLTDIADSQKVDAKTVQDAIAAARETDLQQAVKDGLITQDQYDTFKMFSDQGIPFGPGTQGRATPDASMGRPERPGIGNGNLPQGFGRGFGGISPFYQVKTFKVAADVIGISCVDLAKAVQNGQTIAQVATGKSIQVQTVIDALVEAETEALTKGLTDKLLEQDVVDARLKDLSTNIEALVNNPIQNGFGPGGPGNGGPRPGGPDRDGPGGPDGKP
jgi:hypothetical protein